MGAEALVGGSINIFYNIINKKGTINAIGGNGGQPLAINGGNGGNGSVSYGRISTGTYEEYQESVE